jgi:hypothetical protein
MIRCPALVILVFRIATLHNFRELVLKTFFDFLDLV